MTAHANRIDFVQHGDGGLYQKFNARRKAGSSKPGQEDQVLEWVAGDLGVAVKNLISNACNSLEIARDLVAFSDSSEILGKLKEINGELLSLSFNFNCDQQIFQNEETLRHVLLQSDSPDILTQGGASVQLREYLFDQIKFKLRMMTGQQVDTLICLLSLSGKIVQNETLKVAVKSRSCNSSAMKVRINRIRTLLNPIGFGDLIVTRHKGYIIEKPSANLFIKFIVNDGSN